MVDIDHMKGKVSRLRENVLNFSKSNKLLNFKHAATTKSYLRVVDELPEIVFQKLSDGGMAFKALPPWEQEPDDQRTLEFQNALRDAEAENEAHRERLIQLGDNPSEAERREVQNQLIDLVRASLEMPRIDRAPEPDMAQHALVHGFNPNHDLPNEDGGKQHLDNQIQVLLLQKDLDVRLRNIWRNYRESMQESGINNFHAIFGFLEWEETRGGNSNKFLSPLLTTNINIKRDPTPRGHRYTMRSETGEQELNETLRLKLLSDFGHNLPEFDVELDNPIETFFSEMESFVEDKEGWSFKRYITFAFLPFTKIEIYKDLDVNNWGDDNSLYTHEIIARMFGGLDANEVFRFEDNEPIDELSLAGEAPPLVLPADSSQHSAIKRSMDRSLVIQGPPGTGKSQTIANLIASAIAEGKKVLFLAEKQPALEVVRQRLKSVGLSNIMFFPTKNKNEVFDSIKESIELLGITENYDNEQEIVLNETIENGIKLKKLLSVETGFCSLNFYELAWRFINLKEKMKEVEAIDGPGINIQIPINTINNERLRHYQSVIEGFLGMNNPIEADNTLAILERVRNAPVGSLAIEDFKKWVQQGIGQINNLQTKINDLNIGLEHLPTDKIKLLFEHLNEIKPIEHLRKLFQVANDENKIANQKAHLEKFLHFEQVRNSIEVYGNFRDLNVELLKELDEFLEDSGIKLKDAKPSKIEEKQRKIDILKKVKTYLSKIEIVLPTTAQVIKFIKEIEAFDFDISSLNNTQSTLLKDNEIEKLETFENKLKELESLKKDPLYIGNKNLKLLADQYNLVTETGSYTLTILKDHQKTYEEAGVISRFTQPYKRALKFIQDIGFDPSREDCNGQLKGLIKLFETANSLAQSKLEVLDYPNRDFVNENNKEVFDTIEKVKKLDGVRERLRNINSNLTLSIKKIGMLKSNFLAEDGIKDLLNNSDLEENEAPLNKIIEEIEKEKNVLEKAKSLTQKSGLNFENKIKLRNLEIELGGVKERKSLSDWVKLLNKIDASLKENEEDFGGSIEEGKLISSALASIKKANDLLITSGLKSISSARDFRDIVDSNLIEDYLEAEENIELIANKHLDRLADFSIANFESVLADLEPLLTINVVVAATGMNRQQLLDDPKNSEIRPFLLKIQNMNITIDLAKNYFEWLLVRKELSSFQQNHALALSELTGDFIRSNKNRFRHADNNLYKINAKKINNMVCSRQPPVGRSSGKVSTYTELSLLRQQMQTQRKSSIRDVVSRAFDAIITMKPVWFMQPVNVSKFLKKEPNSFDLLVIDEASQMFPEMALGAMVRSKEIVVVGDEQQMPPQSFFNAALAEDEDEEYYGDAESILKLAGQRIGNTVSLNWHYRSLHPSLIQFSNYNFYGNRLEVFPSPFEASDDFGVKLVEANGVYTGGSVNPEERDEVIRQVRKCIREFPMESIGVVAMNRPQTDSITEALYQLRDEDSEVREYFDRWENDDLGSLFVKNLANVQGDERDIIIISTVFGKNETGQLRQNFGFNIASPVGHRYLNVLFTRARKLLILVTSMRPADIKVTPTTHRGVKILSDYIQYAATGRIEVGETTESSPDSDFEISVGEFLKEMGFQVTYQVGVKGFKIDIGIKHESFPYGYIAGIECDGATYHSSLNARDRDKVRQEILESFGWKIYRIWSTDWFNDEKGEREKFKTWINKLLIDSTRPEIEIQDDTEPYEPEIPNESISQTNNIPNIEGDFFRIEQYENIEPLHDSRNFSFDANDLNRLRSQNIQNGHLINRGFPTTHQELGELIDCYNRNKSIEDMEAYFQRSRITIANLLNDRNYPIDIESREPIRDNSEEVITEEQVESYHNDTSQELSGPTGQERELEHGEYTITFYEPVRGFYEIWNTNRTQRVGEIEKKIGVTNRPVYVASNLLRENVFRQFDDIYASLRWLHDSVNEDANASVN